MQKSKQMSESFYISSLLAFVGGFLDVYSYLYRGEVFATMQTGNIVYLAIAVAEKQWHMTCKYIFPIVAFAIGIALAVNIKHFFANKTSIHWRQISVLIEIVLLLNISFLSVNINIFANSLVAVVCGIQVESFRKVHGNNMATTMCTGNLRSAIENLSIYALENKVQAKEKFFLYIGIIFSFFIGAFLSDICVRYMASKTTLIAAAVLLIVFILMFKNEGSDKTC